MIFLSSKIAPPNTEVIYLDFWDKLAIISAAGLFLALVIVCMVCVLSPMCWLYQHCPFQYHEVPQIKHYTSTDSEYGAVESVPINKKRKPPDKLIQDKTRMGSLREHESSDWSDSSSTIELKRTSRRSPSLLSGVLYSDQPTIALASGKLEFNLKYVTSEGKLTIKIIEVEKLTIENISEIISPYVRVRFYRAPKQLFSFGKDSVINNLDLEVCTKMQKASDNPVYNETFVVSIDPKDIRYYTIKLQLCDLDHFSRHIVLGEATLILKKLEIPEGEDLHMSEILEPPSDEDLGEINIGLNYLPTAEKLYLTIAKVKGLKAMDKESNTTDAYAKLALMHDGRQIKKSKTAIKPSDLNPEYDETVAFDVPKHHLNNVYFCIAIIHASKERGEHRLIGRLYLGPNFGVDANAHWMEMTQNPRKQVTCWHKLHC